MVKKITNVTHVERHFLKQDIWRDTLIQSIMDKRLLLKIQFSHALSFKKNYNSVHVLTWTKNNEKSWIHYFNELIDFKIQLFTDFRLLSTMY